MDNEQADAGRDDRTCLARPNSQARTGTDREEFIFPVQLTTSRIGNHTRLIHTALCHNKSSDGHTCSTQLSQAESGRCFRDAFFLAKNIPRTYFLGKLF